MFKLSALVVIISSVLSISACTEKQAEMASPQDRKESAKTVHSGSAGPASSGEAAVTEAIKKQVLPDFPALPIGTALDGYSHFTAHEWKGTQAETGKYYVDCIGWLDAGTMDVASLKDGVSKRGVAVKFVVVQDGSFRLAMVSRLEAKSDGSVVSYPAADAKLILERIYANKEITF